MRPAGGKEHPVLDGWRIMVVGASSGIGQAIAIAALGAGARLALAARRLDRLEAVATTAPGRARAFACDVADEATVRSTVQGAASWLGGLDAVIYASASAPLSSVGSTSAARWHGLLATNVVGAACVVAGALPHLRDSPRGTIVLLSSHSVGDPWPGLVPYAASKAALNELGLGLRAEEPGLRVLRITVGPTATAFADQWDPKQASEAFDRWARDGYLRHRVLEAPEVADAVLAALWGTGPDDLTIIGDAPG